MKQRMVKILALATAMGLLSFPLCAEEEGTDGMSFSSFGEDDSTPSLSVNGTAETEMRWFLDDGNDSTVSSDPSLALSLGYSAEKVEMDAKLKLSKEILENYPEDALQEMTIRAYMGDFVAEGGKMKLVWGKGDKLHVLDNFNADDYTDFVIPDYIDRRLAVPMAHLVYNGPDSLRVEAAYVPFLVPDRYATEGRWTPSLYTDSVQTVSFLATAYADQAYRSTYASVYASAVNTGVPADAAAIAASDYASLMQSVYLAKVEAQNGLYADTHSLKYRQFGFRVTGTVGSFDWGASYYDGFEKQPTLRQDRLKAWIADPSTDVDPPLDYDSLRVFGVEGATAVGRFNFRMEGAYNLTDDVAGTDGNVRNNSIGWVFGVDFDVVGNLNVNLQTKGSVILGADGIKDNGTSDIEYSAKDRYHDDTLALALSDSFLHERLKAECDMVYDIESNDLAVMPKLTYSITDGLDASLSGLYIHADDEEGDFYSFADNSFVQAKIVYSF